MGNNFNKYKKVEQQEIKYNMYAENLYNICSENRVNNIIKYYDTLNSYTDFVDSFTKICAEDKSEYFEISMIKLKEFCLKNTYYYGRNFYTKIMTDLIFTATIYGSYNIVSVIAKNNKSDIYNYDLSRCVLIASEKGHLNIIKILAKFTNYSKSILNLAFVFACENGHLDIVKYLANIGVTYYDFGIRSAIKANKTMIVKYLVNNLNNIDEYIELAKKINNQNIVKILEAKN